MYKNDYPLHNDLEVCNKISLWNSPVNPDFENHLSAPYNPL